MQHVEPVPLRPDHAAGLGEAFLQPGAPSLRFEDLLAFSVMADRHELQCDLPRMPRILGQKDRGHAAALGCFDELTVVFLCQALRGKASAGDAPQK